MRENRNRNPTSARIGFVVDQTSGRRLALFLAVWTVKVELAAAEPGVTLDGAKLAVAPAGKPLAVSVTALVKAPPCGVTLMVYATLPPSITDWDAGVALS